MNEELDPYRRLALAILVGAFECLARGGNGLARGDCRYEFRHAVHWIFSDAPRAPLRYEDLCEFVCVDPRAGRRVAKRILRAVRRGTTDQKLAEVKRKYLGLLTGLRAKR